MIRIPVRPGAVMIAAALVTSSSHATTAAQTTAAKTASVAPVAAPDAEQQALIDALQIRDGSIVGELGAGKGEMTIAVARRVGPTGRVYSSELGDRNLRTLREAVEKAKLTNVTVIEADPLKTNLPDQCCDALFMQRVYHHFEDPAAMNVALWQALEPGGRLVVEDFPPRGSEAEKPSDRDTDDHHGVTAETVARELQQAGFEQVGLEKVNEDGFRVIVRKPASAAPARPR